MRKLRTRRTVLVGAAGLALLSIAAAGALQTNRFALAQPGVPSGGEGSLLVTGYKKWARVNPKPHFVYGRYAALCAAPPSPQQQASADAADPHANKFVTVYVNEIGKRAMLHQKTPVFPRGSVIVKEKITSENSGEPELLTVMHKREPGYNPASGDWEYLVLNGTGTRVKAEGRLPNCQSCHARWQQTGYVSRVYLPDTTRRSLK